FRARLGCNGSCGSERSTMEDIGDLIVQMRSGDERARDRLFAAAYGELRQLARSRLREGARSTVLDTTALVHESYLRFLDAGALRSDDRRSFFAYASRVMRSVIIDSIRERRAERHGGDVGQVTLDKQNADRLPGRA